MFNSLTACRGSPLQNHLIVSPFLTQRPEQLHCPRIALCSLLAAINAFELELDHRFHETLQCYRQGTSHANKLVPAHTLIISNDNLADAPLFYVLAYCCGWPAQNEACLCEHSDAPGRLLLTPSLNEILEPMRLDNFSDDLPLWICQICISQNDNARKSRQAKLMGRVNDAAEGQRIVDVRVMESFRHCACFL